MASSGGPDSPALKEVPARGEAIQTVEELAPVGGVKKVAVVSATMPASETIPAPSPDETPRFYLFFLNYGELCICGSLTAQASLDQRMRRFCDDVALSILRNPAKGELTELRWPIVESRAIPQSMDDAREWVVSNMVQMPYPRLVFGNEFAQIASGEDDVSSPGSSSQESERRRTMVVSEDLVSHLNNPIAKRALWVRICHANLCGD